MSAEFTKEMKSEYTILSPDIFPTHMELLTEIFKMYGYNVQVLHYEGKSVIDTGLKYLHNDMCYPAVCAIGQQLYALSCGDYDPHKCAVIQFQTGGGCRASNYIWLLRKALKNMGMEYVPVISLSLESLERSSGFHITPMMLAKCVLAIIYGDMLMLLKNQTTPYEINKGDTRAVVEHWIKELTDQLSRGKGLSRKTLRKNLYNMAKSFSEIKREKKELTKVGIVGEIYVKYSAFGNNGLEEFLASQNCEVMVPGVLGFFQYCCANPSLDYKFYGGSKIKQIASSFAEKFMGMMEKTMLDILKEFPEFAAPAPFGKLKQCAASVIDMGVKMGEGWLLPGEIVELIEKGYSNVICAQPFGCLPNHIVGKGVIRNIRTLYPEANVFPIDYDAGASRVNQENRIKLMLAIAREEKA